VDDLEKEMEELERRTTIAGGAGVPLPEDKEYLYLARGIREQRIDI
jgi:hypothetical protein